MRGVESGRQSQTGDRENERKWSAKAHAIYSVASHLNLLSLLAYLYEDIIWKSEEEMAIAQRQIIIIFYMLLQTALFLPVLLRVATAFTCDAYYLDDVHTTNIIEHFGRALNSSDVFGRFGSVFFSLFRFISFF